MKNKFINVRNANEGSTSRYLQQKVPNEKGIPSRQVSKLNETPDQNILDNLLSITQSIRSFGKTLIQGAITALNPTAVETKIKEKAPTPERAEYGQIQVQETSGGHVIIVDDTENNKRLIRQHANGTYDSMTDKGDRTEKVVKDSYTFIRRDMIIHVERDQVRIISGNSNLEIRGSESRQVAGNKMVNIDGDDETKVGGDHIVDATGNVSNNAGSGYGSKCAENRDIVTGGNSNENVTGNDNKTIGGSKNETISGSEVKNVNGSLSIVANGAITIVSSSQVVVTAPIISLN